MTVENIEEVISAGANEGTAVTLDDFWAYMPLHTYIFAPSREMWPAASVDAKLGKIPLFDDGGQPVLDESGKQVKLRASTWLDQNRPVEQMTWSPGLPMIIRDRLISDGGWIERTGVTCFNLYRPPTLTHGDAALAQPWIDHVRRVYPNEADRLIRYFAYKIQYPGEKINHGIVMGGEPGIGKDTILEPVKRAVGPWNCMEVNPKQMLGRFNSFAKSVILRISEARDLGDVDRFQFYEHMKTYAAAPPDVLRCDEKNIREHSVVNCCAPIITTNRKDSLYIPANCRRNYVLWSDLEERNFTPDYWNRIWAYYNDGGDRHVAAYLATLDVSDFDPKAPPPKTAAFWQIVGLNQVPEDADLADVLDQLGNPDATTVAKIVKTVQNDFNGSHAFYDWLTDRRNIRAIPHRMEKCGYVSVQNDSRKDGFWLIDKKRQAVYAKKDLSFRDQHAAAVAFVAAMQGPERTTRT